MGCVLARTVCEGELGAVRANTNPNKNPGANGNPVRRIAGRFRALVRHSQRTRRPVSCLMLAAMEAALSIRISKGLKTFRFRARNRQAPALYRNSK